MPDNTAFPVLLPTVAMRSMAHTGVYMPLISPCLFTEGLVFCKWVINCSIFRMNKDRGETDKQHHFEKKVSWPQWDESAGKAILFSMNKSRIFSPFSHGYPMFRLRPTIHGLNLNQFHWSADSLIGNPWLQERNLHCVWPPLAGDPRQIPCWVRSEWVQMSHIWHGCTFFFSTIS